MWRMLHVRFVNWLKFFLYLFKNKIIINFVKYLATKKLRTIFFFLLFLFLLLDPGSEMDKKKSGSGIIIPDQQP